MNSEIKYYLEKKNEGVEYSEIRKEMVKNGYSKKDITFLINEIDDYHIESIERKIALNPFTITSDLLFVIIGLIFLIICVAICWAMIVTQRAGILDIMILTGSFSMGSYLYYKGKNSLSRANELRKKQKSDFEDILD